MSSNIPNQAIGADPADVPETGRYIIRLDRSIRSNELNLLQLSRSARLTALENFLDTVPKTAPERVFDHIAPERIREREEAGRRGEYPSLHSMADYWRLDLRPVDDAESVREALAEMPEIEAGYDEPAVMPASSSVSSNTYLSDQGFLDAAPVGIDARSAWGRTNGMGEGVAAVDVESGWIVGHEDLPEFTVLEGTNGVDDGYSNGNHGAAALGVVGALNNHLGTIGVAPNLKALDVASHYDGTTRSDLHVGKAIDKAALSLSPGDIIYLEVQRPVAGIAYPTEIVSHDLQAIRAAANQGIIVIEAAGNNFPSFDLGNWMDPLGEHSLGQGADPASNSGAIMVGSCQSTVKSDSGGEEGHERYYTSNYGQRVDCHAWGEGVYTAGAHNGSLPGATAPTNSYTGSFGQTSAATAIIAGAAAVVQSWYMTWCGKPLSPAQMRAILSSEANGTKQINIAGDPIGVMPNLKAIMTCRRRLIQILLCVMSRLSRRKGLNLREFEQFKFRRADE